MLQTIFYQPVYNLLFYFVHILPGESFGLAVIALTLVVRFILFPSSAKAVRAQREMAAIQPEQEKIREKYKNDPQNPKMNEEIFQLYKEHNVNPLGACLPLIIQLPFLFILYKVFIDGITPDHYNLLYSFVPTPENLNTIFLNTDLKTPSYIFALLASILQFFQTWQISKKANKTQTVLQEGDKKEVSPTDMAKNMTSKVVYIMPIITYFIASTLPSALALYWVVTTVFSIVQQWWIMKTHPEIANPHVAVSIKGKSKKKRKS